MPPPSAFSQAFAARGAHVFESILDVAWIDEYRNRVLTYAEKLNDGIVKSAEQEELPQHLRSFRDRGVFNLSIATLQRDGAEKSLLLEIVFRLKAAGVLEALETFFGEKCYFMLDASSIRMHRPSTDIIKSRLNFHQEAAAFSYPKSDFCGCVIWIPLEQIFEGMPSFQFINRKFDDVLPHAGNSISGMIEIENQGDFQDVYAADIVDAHNLSTGDVVVISPLTPHRTVTPSDFSRRRVSLDLRVAIETGYPTGYAGSAMRP